MEAKEEVPSMIQVTEKALGLIRDILKDEPEGTVVRVQVSPG